MDQQWFEMPEMFRGNLNDRVWIPLRAVKKLRNEIQYGFEGYKEEFYGAGSIAVPSDMKEKVENLGWSDIGIGIDQIGHCIDDSYFPSDEYLNYQNELLGTHLVLAQRFPGEEFDEWHLHQDLVVTLGLLRETDKWICPSEGYTGVVRLGRNDRGKPELIEIRAEHLKDYLCARGMHLYETSYYSRRYVSDDSSFIDWEDGTKEIREDDFRWDGRIQEIHEGGGRYGHSWAVIHTARTDVDETDDVPDISELPTEENSTTTTWDKYDGGRKLFHIISELWRNEWVEPAEKSPRIKREASYQSVFIIDAEGNTAEREELIDSGKWLWFGPEVITSLTQRRGGSLNWLTGDTGSVGCVPDLVVHFGMNDLGLINVFAKDIAYLPDWQQRIWAGHNVGPEGGVSSELIDSQVRASPADTQSPELYLQLGIYRLSEVASEVLGISILRNHSAVPDIIKRTHRFRSIDNEGLFSLAKDLARLTADNINEGEIQGIVQPPEGETWKSLKSLENLISQKVPNELARSITGPLVGAYDLRHADAHLPSEDLDDTYELVKINGEMPFVIQGRQLIKSATTSIWTVIHIIENWDKFPKKQEQ